MNQTSQGSKTRAYPDPPAYANFDAPRKFQAIQGIVARRLREHPKAVCSYSGGADSDILIDLVERTRGMFGLPPIKYVFFNTGLEMKATKDHVKATVEKYGVEIEERRPKTSIVTAVRRYGIPFMSKRYSQTLSHWQQGERVPFAIADEYAAAEDKPAKYRELKERYPGKVDVINAVCCCDCGGEPCRPVQMHFAREKYLMDFLTEHPPDFQISARCCDYCKKRPAHEAQRGYEMVITGERRAEGGIRTANANGRISAETPCFYQTRSQYRLRPLYYVSDSDKAWYKETYGLRYSDAYEVYGLTRTGCCGCSISYKAAEDLERIRPYEPNVVKAAWNVFGKSYEYRRAYNEYKARRRAEERGIAGQMFMEEVRP